MAPFGRPCRAYDCLLVRHCEYSSILYVLSYLTLNNIVTLKSGLELRSLKVIQTGTIQKFGCGFLYSPSIVTMALYCIILEINRDIGQNS